MRIGFVGLGQMGRPMAENLLKAGHAVVAHNRSRGVIDALAAQGATAGVFAAEVARGCDVFMTCLLYPEQLRDIYFGTDGALAAIRPGQFCIDFATVEPKLSREIGDAVAAQGGRFLDAPISGGPKGAAAATLSIMVGGADADFVAMRPAVRGARQETLPHGSGGGGGVDQDLQSNPDRRHPCAGR